MRQSELTRAVVRAAVSAGLVQETSDRLMWPVSMDVEGVVDLNELTDPGPGINPVVGIRYLPVERLVSQIMPDLDPNLAVTVTDLLINIVESDTGLQQDSWYVFDGYDPEPVVADLIDRLMVNGRRWVRENGNVEFVASKLIWNFPIRGGEPHRMPRLACLQLLRDQPGDALLTLSYGIAAYGDRTDEAAHHARRFADRFRKYVAAR